ncbi:MAG: aspartyl protease family protein [Methanosarcinales archaeon]
MSEYIFEYIDNDPLILVKLINPLSGKEVEVYAYVDSGSDTIVITRELWDELEIAMYERANISVVGGVITTWYTLLNVEIIGDMYEDVIVFYQEEGDVLLGRTIIDYYVVTLDGVNSVLTINKII